MNTTKLNKLWATPPLPQFKAIFADHIEEFRIIGGAVRDALMGRKVTDIDLATTLTPKALMGLCSKRGLNIKILLQIMGP